MPFASTRTCPTSCGVVREDRVIGFKVAYASNIAVSLATLMPESRFFSAASPISTAETVQCKRHLHGQAVLDMLDVAGLICVGVGRADNDIGRALNSGCHAHDVLQPT